MQTDQDQGIIHKVYCGFRLCDPVITAAMTVISLCMAMITIYVLTAHQELLFQHGYPFNFLSVFVCIFPAIATPLGSSGYLYFIYEDFVSAAPVAGPIIQS